MTTTTFDPIHWECYLTEPGRGTETARVVDLRTLPEGVKVAIIQAALQVAFRYHNGEYDVEEDSEENDALHELAVSTSHVRDHMHAVNLTICP